MNTYYYYNTAVQEMGLSSAAYRLYHLLAKSANNKNRTSHKSQGTMAKEIGVSISTIYRAIQSLKKAGILKVKHRFCKDGSQSSNIYELTDRPDGQMQLNQEGNVTTSTGKLRPFSENEETIMLSGAAMKVYCYLKSKANQAGVYHATLRTIADDLKVSIRSIQRHMKELLKKGLLCIETLSGKKNSYALKSGTDQSIPPKKGKNKKKKPGKKRTKKVLTREQRILLDEENNRLLAEIKEEYEWELAEEWMNALYRIFFLRL